MFWSLDEITVDRHLDFSCAATVLSALCTLSHYFTNNSIIDFTVTFEIRLCAYLHVLYVHIFKSCYTY